jgi:hypothetical protein
MGKRSRKRGVGEGMVAPPDPGRAPAPPGKRRPAGFGDRMLAAADARPKPPWHPFPLVELCVLAGMVLIVWGFFSFKDREGPILLAMGLVLASLGGLDTALRDHFAGLRSHTMLLAGLPSVLAAGALFFARVPWPAVVVAAVALFAIFFWFFRTQFRKRAGVAFRA